MSKQQKDMEENVFRHLIKAKFVCCNNPGSNKKEHHPKQVKVKCFWKEYH